MKRPTTSEGCRRRYIKCIQNPQNTNEQKLQYLASNVQLLETEPKNNQNSLYESELKKNFYTLQHLPSKLAYSLPPKDEDWNDLDRSRGRGSARKYLEDNVYILNMKTIAKLFVKLSIQK